MRIGLFGGSFDPIHEGHLAVAQAARSQFHLDQILFIPAFHSPFKTSQTLKTPAADRLNMVQLAVQGQTGFEVSDLEIQRGGISYTIETLRVLKKTHPGDSFFLILGADSFSHFTSWKHFQEIPALAEILVAPRSDGQPENFPRGISYKKIQMNLVSASSTQIRGNAVSSGHELPRAVQQYIHDHKLYRKESGSS